MNAIIPISTVVPMDLAKHAKSYRFNALKFLAVEDKIFEKIVAYDLRTAPDGKTSGYGHYLIGHLTRTSQYLKEFLIGGGYDQETAKKISAAFRIHDAGKILQPISLWEHTTEKPDDIKKRFRAEHTQLGKIALNDALAELGMTLDDDDKRHIETITYLMESHHERINGSGPLKFTGENMDLVLKMATILDEIDGKIKLEHNSLESIFNDIRSDKHKAKFDPYLVDACQLYCRQYGRFNNLNPNMVFQPSI